ncbi:MAG: DUF2796 domain-containing protein [Candidatus Promineifilaceae bacterium]|nr:DUF2796 domain-containing protein [Candidatus Promineifilaceae bacterium]
MFRYWLFFCLLLIISSACSPAASEATAPQPVDSEEVSMDDHDEEQHEEHDDDHEETHDEDHDGDHEHEEQGEAEEHREHGAHEHGAAIMTIAWSGNELAIDLETPAYNVVGFEYAPTSAEEIALLDESVAALEVGDLLQLSPEAECTVSSAVVKTDLKEAAHEEDGGAAETHSDIDIAYAVQCQNPDDLESLDANGLFVRFPNFEVLQVQWISDTQQSASELTPDDPVVLLR